ncbi:putative tRNA delta (2)-isopentenylpyrophosphate transferase [Megalodesulfovibrio gigas DSM 1382 = ATCC 19364]|uniref:tRNA dimethylallyltransferase n=1 Tax=Megalodesulfovibrio gigas (strain ATCC 19364 / DSM 1382 / NCIMB 9332 / VKM B-1759) TaxID=1121448 RepID=T2G762_MEGG1|nr:putative tRNA delta (2)-isopentenylpyrophosphate transferase [Megalodesulfovibrio gigas DSM 1382 = ATCC 19364]
MGKTAASLHLARAFDGVVINLDSRQVYADFPVITAQPTPEEQAACPHFLYGFLPAGEKISAGRFAELAGGLALEQWRQGRLPLVVGGTGLYLRALVQGLAEIPPVPEDIQRQILADLARHGPEVLHARLATVDPASAARLAPRDRQRIARALEVHVTTGRSLTWWHEEQARTAPTRPFRALVLHLDQPNERLYPRLRLRIELMVDAGARDEIARAWNRLPDETAPGYSGIGCAEVLAWHLGRMQKDEALALWERNTRAYVKRQRTWFRKEAGRVDLAPEELERMEALVREFLKG